MIGSLNLLRVGRLPAVVASLILLLALSVGESRAQNIIRHWEIAGPYPVDQAVRDAYPDCDLILSALWQEVEADSAGLVNLGFLLPREHTTGDLVFARHVFFSSQDQEVTLSWGHTEELDLSINGELWFRARSPQNFLQPSAGGVFVPEHRGPIQVKAGINEIFFVVTSRSDLWGFAASTSIPLEPVPADSGNPVPLPWCPSGF